MILGSAPVTSATLTAIKDGRVYAKLNSIPTPSLNGGPLLLRYFFVMPHHKWRHELPTSYREKLLDAKPGVRVSARSELFKLAVTSAFPWRLEIDQSMPNSGGNGCIE